MNQDVADCVTQGVELDTPADVEKGNCLQIRKSMVDRIFPTQQEVGLLAHAREVDLNDTELMMGDDDGFLAVVIANRLPLPGRDAEGRDTPVKYLACLVNLCEQLPQLLREGARPQAVHDPSRGGAGDLHPEPGRERPPGHGHGRTGPRARWRPRRRAATEVRRMTSTPASRRRTRTSPGGRPQREDPRHRRRVRRDGPRLPRRRGDRAAAGPDPAVPGADPLELHHRRATRPSSR